MSSMISKRKINDLESKQQKAEKELKSRMNEIENEYKKKKDTENSQEGAKGKGGKKGGQAVELDDIEVASKTDAEGKAAKTKGKATKTIKQVKKGEGSWKWAIF